MAVAADAELILKLYKLRTEETMREARKFVGSFNPANFDELAALHRDTSSINNAYWRQVLSYWEMASAFVLHGALDGDLYCASNGEPFFYYAKFTPFLDEWKATFGTPLLRQTAMVIEKYPEAKQRYEMMVARMNAAKSEPRDSSMRIPQKPQSLTFDRVLLNCFPLVPVQQPAREPARGMPTMQTIRRNHDEGFTLIELLIVMSIILILITLAIPQYTKVTKTTHETSAINSLKQINSAETSYNSAYPQNGYSCTLAALGGVSGSGTPSATSAQILDPALAATGTKAGYLFTVTNCTKQSVAGTDMYTSYQVNATPITVGKTGDRGFCMDDNGIIKFDPAGGTSCTQSLQ